MSLDEGKLVEEWRKLLAPDSSWSGVEDLMRSNSCERILHFVFTSLLPIVSPCNSSIIRDVAFQDLQRAWGCERLVEAEPQIVEQVVRTNLDRDTERDGFEQFAVCVGTEAKHGSAYWVLRVDKAILKTLFRTRFIQIGSFIGSTFRGYRIWRIRNGGGKETIALAAYSGSTLL